LAGGNVQDASKFGAKGNVSECGGNVPYIDEVTGLQAISMNGQWRACLGSLKKARNCCGIGTKGVLAGAIHVEKAEGDGREDRFGAQLFTGEF
jgi:hypothetical protein